MDKKTTNRDDLQHIYQKTQKVLKETTMTRDDDDDKKVESIEKIRLDSDLKKLKDQQREVNELYQQLDEPPHVDPEAVINLLADLANSGYGDLRIRMVDSDMLILAPSSGGKYHQVAKLRVLNY